MASVQGGHRRRASWEARRSNFILFWGDIAVGARLVWQLAEADRARYGVFRQAEFGEVEVDPELVRGLLDRLIAVRKTILDWSVSQ